MERYLLGIDIGTTGTKTMLFSAERGLIAAGYMAYELRTPHPGFSEQLPEDWWAAVVKTVRTVCRKLEDPRQVAAMSLSLQGGTLVPVDKAFRPTAPAIVWNDKRCAAEAQEFQMRFGRNYLYEKSGWRMGRGLNALEILWLRRNQPEVFRRTAMFLSVPDYIAAKLTGIPALDISSVGINQLADIRAGRYDRDILDFIGVRTEQLGKIVRSGDVIGPLTPQAAAELGLTEDTVLIAGAHDQYAAAAGAGCSHPGDILIGTGTAWVVTALSDQPDFSGEYSQSVSAGGLWGSLASITNGSISMEWFRKKLAAGGDGLSYEQIDQMAERSGVGARGIRFYPYFAGASYPLQGAAGAALTGMDLSHDASDVARSIMEGVAFQTAWVLERFRKRFSVKGLKFSGGVAKSPLWSQIVADILDLPIQVPAVADLACVGAALLAGTGSGVFASMEEGYHRLKAPEKEVLPNPDRAAEYSRCFAAYKNGAEALCSGS